MLQLHYNRLRAFHWPLKPRFSLLVFTQTRPRRTATTAHLLWWLYLNYRLNLKGLKAPSNLKRLEFHHCALTDADLTYLKQLTDPETLRFGGSYWGGDCRSSPFPQLSCAMI